MKFNEERREYICHICGDSSKEDTRFFKCDDCGETACFECCEVDKDGYCQCDECNTKEFGLSPHDF